MGRRGEETTPGRLLSHKKWISVLLVIHVQLCIKTILILIPALDISIVQDYHTILDKKGSWATIVLPIEHVIMGNNSPANSQPQVFY